MVAYPTDLWLYSVKLARRDDTVRRVGREDTSTTFDGLVVEGPIAPILLEISTKVSIK